MKIKVFTAHDPETLEKQVNEFIRDVKVVSTQFSIRPAANDRYTQYVVLVTYGS
jgi:hypothetical protein